MLNNTFRKIQAALIIWQVTLLGLLDLQTDLMFGGDYDPIPFSIGVVLVSFGFVIYILYHCILGINKRMLTIEKIGLGLGEQLIFAFLMLGLLALSFHLTTLDYYTTTNTLGGMIFTPNFETLAKMSWVAFVLWSMVNVWTVFKWIFRK